MNEKDKLKDGICKKLSQGLSFILDKQLFNSSFNFVYLGVHISLTDLDILHDKQGTIFSNHWKCSLGILYFKIIHMESLFKSEIWQYWKNPLECLHSTEWNDKAVTMFKNLIFLVISWIYLAMSANNNSNNNNNNNERKFGIKKYAMLIMRSGKRLIMKLPNQKKYQNARKEKENYKYLGILETNPIKQVEMKEKIKEYFRRMRKLLESKLYSGNLIKEINTLVASLVRCTGPFLKWTRKELQQMDQRTRKLCIRPYIWEMTYQTIHDKKRRRKRTHQDWR